MENKIGLFCKNIKIPFIVKSDSNTNISFKVSKKEYNLSNENVNIYLTIESIKNNNKKKCIEMVNNLQLDEEKINNPYSMIIYFVKENDTLWNIGKSFNVSIDSICKYNNIEDNILNPGKKLYIVR